MKFRIIVLIIFLVFVFDFFSFFGGGETNLNFGCRFNLWSYTRKEWFFSLKKNLSPPPFFKLKINNNLPIVGRGMMKVVDEDGHNLKIQSSVVNEKKMAQRNCDEFGC